MDKKTALLIVDIQNDYFEGGANTLSGSLEASLKAKEILELFRKNELPVIHVQHISLKKGAAFFVPDTKGVEIHDNVKPLEKENVIVKYFPNSFIETGLKNLLEQMHITDLVICGMMTHMCVDSTTRAARELNFNCTVIADACATKELEFNGKKASAECVQTAFLAALDNIFAKVQISQDFMKDFK